MKILIVDDEALVRSGLKNSIQWEKLGLSEVLLAEDGAEALRLAQQARPDIVLTDVRMPQMDGIDLAARLRRVLPGIHVIFMSGYSDKAYLKAAIQLKAVSYVEKPISCAEIEAAVAEAIRLVQEHSSNLEAQCIRSRTERAQLAMALAGPAEQDADRIRARWRALGLPPAGKLWFSTILLHLTSLADGEELPGLPDFLSRLQEYVQPRQLAFLYSVRGNRVLLHLYAAAELTRERVAWFCLRLQEYLRLHCQFFIAAGRPAQGLHHVAQSYRSAAEALEGGFYGELNAVLLWSEQPEAPAFLDCKAHIAAFRAAMAAGDCAQARQAEAQLYEAVRGRRQPSTDAIRNAYYQMVSVLEWTAAKSCVPFSAAVQERTPWEIVSASRTAGELHAYFSELLETYARLSAQEKEKNSLVFLMKEYIRTHYRRDMLSVREIAEAACLSPAYACTMFKNETGTTINQYISTYRVERAKRLLEDPRSKISDIAAQLGYSDSNYFGKSFKRLVGLSPSEYREKVTHWES